MKFHPKFITSNLVSFAHKGMGELGCKHFNFFLNLLSSFGGKIYPHIFFILWILVLETLGSVLEGGDLLAVITTIFFLAL